MEQRPTPGALIQTAAEITPSVAPISLQEVKFKACHSRRLSLSSKKPPQSLPFTTYANEHKEALKSF